ncbi:MAG: hypothetical protein RDU24_11465 [Humidesulfovibrio sp.]|uniref:hypothetical protein n=1 Tax=Humidesulfovibrio sp. TaxID=2910988 RepID=UPI0027F85591|nr:hypothetical protein [Humidesulfovibrio sp.]MDQ7835991.1 hypothetical protein [Humidesulfovibrio sp.]
MPTPHSCYGTLRQRLCATLCALALCLASTLAFGAEADSLASARYAEPVDRYGHFALGRPHEYARMEAETTGGARLVLSLPPEEVFEDVAPRLVRLSPASPALLLAIVSNRATGSALALLGLEHGRLAILARSAPIGTARRWLNPVGVADLDGDGVAEIAAVLTPHIGGTLKVYRREGHELKELAALPGFSNHVYGTSEQRLSAIVTTGGTARLLVPDTSRTVLRVLEFQAGRLRETGRCRLAAPVVGPVLPAGEAEVVVTTQNGEQRLAPAHCPPPDGKK